MKRKLTIAIVAVLTFSLILTGCTVAATPAANGDGTATRNGYAGNGANEDGIVARNDYTGNGAYEDGDLTRNGYAGNGVDSVEVGAGYRGGNGNENAGIGYSDDCDPIYDDNYAPDPDFALSATDQALSLAGYGSTGALDDANLTLADMLTYAIQDEYLAYAEYDRILSENGNIRPFTNIIRAEATHIDALLPLFDVYGIAAPADEGASFAVSVGSLTEAYQAGVNAEVNNIAMYETFLDQELPSDVRIVFESLMHASENHLRAFQNQL